MPRSPFKGTINVDVRDSVPDWDPYVPPRAPEGSPNILIVLYDDTGLAAWEPFGGRIRMPTLQRLADNGLRYAQWHTTALGTTRLHVDDEVVAEGTMRTQVGFFTLCGDGLCVGRDSSDPVSSEYAGPATFSGGTIHQVEINVGDDQYIDLEQEAMAALARE